MTELTNERSSNESELLFSTFSVLLVFLPLKLFISDFFYLVYFEQLMKRTT